MGAATRHRQAFLRNHKTCAFCGGGAPSSTIEHCPPRSMFQHRQWPEGFEFPACQACNKGSSDHDLVIAMRVWIRSRTRATSTALRKVS
jgi:hypothetical protein